MRLVTTEEMRALERRAMAAGTSEAELMERAGTAVADAAAEWLANSRDLRLLVLAGKGNNGGDALIAARELRARYGAAPALYLIAPREGDPLLDWARQGDVPLVMHGGDPTMLRTWLTDSNVVLDGLLGIGGRLPLHGAIADVLRLCREIAPPAQRRIAVDVPTGVQSDTGHADEVAFQAHLTLATGPAKPGLFIAPGATHAGRVRALEIGLPPPPATLQRAEAEDVARLLPPRPDDSHKGTFGKLLVIAGSGRYTGAPYLAATAGVRSGAGLVTLAVPHGAQPTLAARSAETTFLPLPDDPNAPGAFTPGHLGTLLDAIGGYSAVVLGPGLGDHPATQEMVRLLAGALADDPHAPPLVVDADGLNALAADASWRWPRSGRWVLTPHPGEMSRLSGQPAKQIQSDRLTVARGYAGTWGEVLVLKGAPSIVAGPDGRATLNSFANAALASAGSGDVLSGVIGGLLAQGCPPFEAAVAGSYVHSLAAELWRAEHGAAGLAASHLAELVPDAQRHLRRLA